MPESIKIRQRWFARLPGFRILRSLERHAPLLVSEETRISGLNASKLFHERTANGAFLKVKFNLRRSFGV